MLASAEDRPVYSTVRLALLRVLVGASAALLLLVQPVATEALLPELAAAWLELPGPLRGAVRLVGLAASFALVAGWGRTGGALVLVLVLAFLAAYGRVSLPLGGSFGLLLVLLAAHPGADVLRLARARIVPRPEVRRLAHWYRAAWVLGIVGLFVLPLPGGSTLTVVCSLLGLGVAVVGIVRGPESRTAAVLTILAAATALASPGSLALFAVLVLWVGLLFDERWVPPVADPGAVLFFDGVCVFCHGAIQLILLEEQKPTLRFAPLQGDLFRERVLLEETGPVESVVLWSNGQAHFRSDAALRTARAMGGVWGLLWGLRRLPVSLLDAAYDWVATNRYGWFGKLEACPIPHAEQRERFVD